MGGRASARRSSAGLPCHFPPRVPKRLSSLRVEGNGPVPEEGGLAAMDAAGADAPLELRRIAAAQAFAHTAAYDAASDPGGCAISSVMGSAGHVRRGGRTKGGGIATYENAASGPRSTRPTAPASPQPNRRGRGAQLHHINSGMR